MQVGSEMPPEDPTIEELLATEAYTRLRPGLAVGAARVYPASWVYIAFWPEASADKYQYWPEHVWPMLNGLRDNLRYIYSLTTADLREYDPDRHRFDGTKDKAYGMYVPRRCADIFIALLLRAFSGDQYKARKLLSLCEWAVAELESLDGADRGIQIRAAEPMTEILADRILAAHSRGFRTDDADTVPTDWTEAAPEDDEPDEDPPAEPAPRQPRLDEIAELTPSERIFLGVLDKLATQSSRGNEFVMPNARRIAAEHFPPRITEKTVARALVALVASRLLIPPNRNRENGPWLIDRNHPWLQEAF